jgi:predicted NAD/FAD-dependent oxidoreductase
LTTTPSVALALLSDAETKLAITRTKRHHQHWHVSISPDARSRPRQTVALSAKPVPQAERVFLAVGRDPQAHNEAVIAGISEPDCWYFNKRFQRW